MCVFQYLSIPVPSECLPAQDLAPLGLSTLPVQGVLVPWVPLICPKCTSFEVKLELWGLILLWGVFLWGLKKLKCK